MDANRNASETLWRAPCHFSRGLAPSRGVFMLAPPVNFVIFMLAVAALGTVAYLALFMSHVPGAKEERFGKLEPLPEHLGTWVRSDTPDADGLLREERIFLSESSEDKLVVQVRYRNSESGRIERILPERIVKRRRIQDKPS